MKMLSSDKMKIPLEELAFINPEPRKKLFMAIVEEYRSRYPSMKLIYAAMNFDSTLQADYVVVFDITVKGERVIMYDTPFLYSNRAIPGYRYCLREGKLDDWFNEATSQMCRIPRDRFFEFINSLDLSVFKEKSNFWKTPENFKPLAEGLIRMFLEYNSNSKK